MVWGIKTKEMDNRTKERGIKTKERVNRAKERGINTKERGNRTKERVLVIWCGVCVVNAVL